MAAPTTTKKMTILLGDGATPTEVFTWPCGANSRGLTITTSMGSEVLLDCTDPTGNPAWESSWAEGKGWSISVSGRVAIGAPWAAWRDWALGVSAKNVRIKIDESAANEGGHFQGSAFLESFEITAEGSATVAFNATLTGSGALTWTDAV